MAHPSVGKRWATRSPMIMTGFGKLIIIFGAILLVIGLAFLLLGRAGVPVGRLPGDILYRGKNTTVYFPLTTSILVSVLRSLVVYAINRLSH